MSKEVLIQHRHSLSTAVGIFRYFQVSAAQTHFSLQGWALNQGHEPNCRNLFTPGRFLYAMKVFLSMQLVLTFLSSHLLHKISLQLLCKTSHGLVQYNHLYLKTVPSKQFKYCSLTSRKIYFYFLQKLLSRQSPSSQFTWTQWLLLGLRSLTYPQMGE